MTLSRHEGNSFAPTDEQLALVSEVSPIGKYENAVVVQPGEVITVVIETESKTYLKNEALLAFQFFDQTLEPLFDPDWPNISASVGAYQYLSTPSENGRTVDIIELVAPDQAETLFIRGIQWEERGQTSIVGEVQIIHEPVEETITETPSGQKREYSSNNFVTRSPIHAGTRSVSVRAEYRAGIEPGSAPVQVIFRDQDGEPLLPTSDLPQHPNFGAFLSLDAKSSQVSESEWILTVPEGSSAIEFRGVEWGPKSATLVGAIEVTPHSSSDDVISEFAKAIRPDQPLLVIDTTAPPIGHPTLSLRPNNLARAYERLGAAVVFIPFGSLQEFPERPSEQILQFKREDFPRALRILEQHRHSCDNTYVCSSFPSLHAVATAAWLKANGWNIVYEARDDMEEFRRVGYSKWYSPQLERQMLLLADLVVAVSQPLMQKLESLVRNLQRREVVPNAVAKATIETAADLRSWAVADARNSSRTFGYVGHLTDSWFDWDLLIEAAKQLPSIEFELVGHGIPANLKLPNNVRFLGPKTHEELQPIVARWRAGLIPFRDEPLTRSVDPNKIYEYQAWGLRVLTAPMGNVENHPSTWIYRSQEQFVKMLTEIAEHDYNPTEVATIRNFAELNDWDSRAALMLQLMANI